MSAREGWCDTGRCKNSNRYRKKGRCTTCDGRGFLVSNHGGRHVHVPCPGCQQRAR